jgi:putative transcriptional regulator
MEPKQPDIVLDAETNARLKRLKSGCVLHACTELKDPNFDRAVVFICVYGEDGAYGVVMNRPSHMPLSEMFDGFADFQGNKKVYIGGPVRQEELQILQVTDEPAPKALQVAPRVWLGGQWDDLQRILESDDHTSHLFLGYSGWASGQLEFEIIAGAWDVYNVDVEKFLAVPEEHWQADAAEVRRRLEQLQV